MYLVPHLHGSYPIMLQNRILGRKGHLSNEMAGSLLVGLDCLPQEVFLAHLSHEDLVQYDNLTGVYSKKTFLRKTKSFMQNNSETAFDIICINIKKFALFNDLLGIDAGSQMLCFIAQHLYTFLHIQKTVFGRLDSDSFIVCARSEDNIGPELLKIFKEHLHEYVVTIRAAVAIGIYHGNAARYISCVISLQVFPKKIPLPFVNRSKHCSSLLI